MKKLITGAFALVTLSMSFPALAAESRTDFSAISNNIISSVADLPGLISGGSYLLALVLGIMGILRLKQHVEDPRSHSLKDAAVRFGAGGALLALPTVYEAIVATISGSGTLTGSMEGIQSAGSAMAISAGNTGGANSDINAILQNIINSIENTPGLFSAAGYLLGLVFGVAGVLQLKDHVQSPENVPLRSGVIKLLAAGSLFGLVTIFTAMWNTISGGAGGSTALSTLAGGMGYSQEAATNSCGTSTGTNSTVGSVICNLYTHSTMFPMFLKAASYLFGIALGFWGILKIKDHVVNPQQTPVWDGVVRLIAGGAMFSLPFVISAVLTSMQGDLKGHTNTSGSATSTASGAGLDKMLTDFMASIFGPTDIILTFFGYIAGIVLVMVGIMRLLKASHEGHRGPGGIGTIMTFVAGGALLSFSPMVAAFSMSLFQDSSTKMSPVLTYTAGLDTSEIQHIQAVIGAMVKFVLLLGLVSFMRGIFIVRGVAEGNQQASVMSGMTHLIGGALAVNLGPFIKVVQTTLGLDQYGVNFQ